MSDDDAVLAAQNLIVGAAQQLVESGARDEALAEWVERKTLFGVRRAAKLEPRGRVWRLGVLLLASDGALFETGVTTRVSEPGRPQNLHSSVEQRRMERAAALKAGYAIGEVVNHGVTRVDMDADRLRSGEGPLLLRDGALWVRWSRSSPDSLAPFGAYLAEHLEFAINPPGGA